MANFREVVTLFVESCYRRGTLYDVLNESGVLLSFEAEGPEEDAMEILIPPTAREKEQTLRIVPTKKVVALFSSTDM